eukprot:scaffold17009_cov78-Skeletonema_dohrnii-CCMP3373.AAC.2
MLGPGTIDVASNDDFDWQREEEAQKKRPWFIIMHNQKARLSWDVIMAIILSVMAFYIPYRVCFFWEQDENEEEKSIFIFESIIDLFFLVDICLNFVTTYRSKMDILITSPRQIALHYIKGYFCIDLLATIPFGYILTSSSLGVANKLGKLGRLPKLIKFVRAARLLKLLRVYRLHEFLVKLEVEYNIHHGYSRMIKIVTLILLVTHMVGCFWFLIGITGGGDDTTDSLNQGWVYRYHLDSSPRYVQYISAMYWAFSTLTTVGYGDIPKCSCGHHQGRERHRQWRIRLCSKVLQRRDLYNQDLSSPSSLPKVLSCLLLPSQSLANLLACGQSLLLTLLPERIFLLLQHANTAATKCVTNDAVTKGKPLAATFHFFIQAKSKT